MACVGYVHPNGQKGLAWRALWSVLKRPYKNYIFLVGCTYYIFYHHLDTRYQKVGDVFCFIFLNQFLTDVHLLEPENTVVGAENLFQVRRTSHSKIEIENLFAKFNPCLPTKKSGIVNWKIFFEQVLVPCAFISRSFRLPVGPVGEWKWGSYIIQLKTSCHIFIPIGWAYLHFYFTLLNHRKKSSFSFCLLALLGIPRNP